MADCILPFLKSKINTNQFDFALFLDDIERDEGYRWLIPNGKTQADVSRWFVGTYYDYYNSTVSPPYSIYRPGEIITGYIHPVLPDQYWIYNQDFDTTTRTCTRQLDARYLPMTPTSHVNNVDPHPLFLLVEWV